MNWETCSRCWGIKERREKLTKIGARGGESTTRLEYRSSIALSYVRENLYGFADREYATLAAEAKSKKYTDLEAALHEAMATIPSG